MGVVECVKHELMQPFNVLYERDGKNNWHIYLSYFLFQPVLHDWCNKGCGMYYPVWDGAYKRTLAANRKEGVRCSSVVRTFAHGAMGRRIDTSWSGPH